MCFFLLQIENVNLIGPKCSILKLSPHQIISQQVVVQHYSLNCFTKRKQSKKKKFNIQALSESIRTWRATEVHYNFQPLAQQNKCMSGTDASNWLAVSV